MDYAEKSGLDQFEHRHGARGSPAIPGRPDYFTHWGGAFKYAASVLGLPIGDYPHSRPPQAEFCPTRPRRRSMTRIGGSGWSSELTVGQSRCGRRYR